jgi:glycine/D-amino acid oxidase-like deaminating enzyme
VSGRFATATDVAVIGGGVVGTATAAFLAEAGLRVRLYERAEVAAGASGRNSGIIQHPFDPVLAELYRASVAEYRKLAASDTGFALPAEPSGLLYVGRRVEAAREAAMAWAAAWPATRPEMLAGEDLRRLEPALAHDLVAFRLAIGYPVEPAAATHAFAALARRRGVEIVLGDARPEIEDGRAIGVRVDGRVEPTGAVLVAAGSWTPALIDPTGAWRPIRSIWGVVAGLAVPDAPTHALEAVDITIEPGVAVDATGEPVEPSDAEVEFSLVPAAGSSALGSTFLRVEPRPEAWLPALRRVGARYVPGVADATLLGLRHCARPVSRDGRPLIGAAPWVDGLWIAAGHGPWGISTGPGTARLVAGRILGRIDEGGIAPELRPDRFGRPST